MSCHAKIVGISGLERYLAREGGETPEKKRAKRFRSEEAARQAARTHLAVFAPVVQRAMSFEVVPADVAGEQLEEEVGDERYDPPHGEPPQPQPPRSEPGSEPHAGADP